MRNFPVSKISILLFLVLCCVASSPHEALARQPAPSPEQIRAQEKDEAAMLARQGQYDEALALLNRLHQQDLNDQNVVRDIVATLGWAGRDAEAVSLYEKLPAGQPDYVLASVGHSYRQLNQTDKALAVYRLGQTIAPTEVAFTEGEIRCLADRGELDVALQKANADIAAHGNRPEIIAAQKDIEQAVLRRDNQAAVQLARGGRYGEALGSLKNLHEKYINDVGVTRDYIAVLDWSNATHDKSVNDEIVSLYKTLPDGDQPDYVLKAVGHAYRNLRQPVDAAPIYLEGQRLYPGDVAFTEGAIRCLVDQKKYKEALAMTDEDLRVHGRRPEIVDIRKNIMRLMPHRRGNHKHHTHHKSG